MTVDVNRLMTVDVNRGMAAANESGRFPARPLGKPGKPPVAQPGPIHPVATGAPALQEPLVEWAAIEWGLPEWEAAIDHQPDRRRGTQGLAATANQRANCNLPGPKLPGATWKRCHEKTTTS